MGGKCTMDNNLFWASLFAFLAIIVIFIAEEIICYLIIKKRGELENYREYKSKRNKLYLYSPYLYKNKKYFFIIKPAVIAFVVLITILLSYFIQNS